MTYEDQLMRRGKELFGSKFRGVFAADEMTVPRMLLPNQCCICNLDPRSSGGSHWIALVQGKTDLLVNDSFGRNVADKGQHTESDPEQMIVEMNCGQRCLAWLCVYYNLGEAAALLI